MRIAQATKARKRRTQPTTYAPLGDDGADPTAGRPVDLRRGLEMQSAGGTGLGGLDTYRPNVHVIGNGQTPFSQVAAPAAPLPAGTGSGWKGSTGSYPVPAGAPAWTSQLNPDEQWLTKVESTWNPSARNKSSGAFGIWQGNPSSGTLQAYAARFGFHPYTTDVNQQITMMRAYIKDRYGTSANAVAHHRRHGWY